MKGKSKAGRIKARKNTVKVAAIREFVKEVNELKQNEKEEETTSNNKKTEEKEEYNVLNRFKIKKKNK